MRVMLHIIPLKHLFLKGMERSVTVKYHSRAEACGSCQELDTSQSIY